MTVREVEVARCGGCGQWVEVDTVCGVCAVDGRCPGCGHPVEWHGRFGCRGWHIDAPSTYTPCPCRRGESAADFAAVTP